MQNYQWVNCFIIIYLNYLLLFIYIYNYITFIANCYIYISSPVSFFKLKYILLKVPVDVHMYNHIPPLAKFKKLHD